MNDIEKALERLKKADNLSKEDREEFLFEYLELCCKTRRQNNNTDKWEMLIKAVGNSNLSVRNIDLFLAKTEKEFKDKEIPLDFLVNLLFYLFKNNY